MVVVKRLDPEYSRMGYEVQKGLMIDMPGGDGKADIVKGEDGSLTLSEKDGKYQVTLKNVALSDFVDHDVQVKLKRTPNANHLTLENVIINSPTSRVISYEGENVISESILSGHNLIEMTGQALSDSFIKDSELDQTTVKDSSVKRSRLQLSRVDASHVVNSDLMNSVVTDDSNVELSKLVSDEVTAATVGGVHSGWALSSFDIDERAFTDGYFVGNGKHANQPDFDHGYVQVTDSDAYVDGLAALVLNRDLPYAWDLEAYRPSRALNERLEEGFASVLDEYKDEVVEMAPFLKDVVGPTIDSLDDEDAWLYLDAQAVAEDPSAVITEDVDKEKIRREAESWVIDDRELPLAGTNMTHDDVTIDESQFEINSQQGLQQ
jgi:hypothetical protein